MSLAHFVFCVWERLQWSCKLLRMFAFLSPFLSVVENSLILVFMGHILYFTNVRLLFNGMQEEWKVEPSILLFLNASAFVRCTMFETDLNITGSTEKYSLISMHCSLCFFVAVFTQAERGRVTNISSQFSISISQHVTNKELFVQQQSSTFLTKRKKRTWMRRNNEIVDWPASRFVFAILI